MDNDLKKLKEAEQAVLDAKWAYKRAHDALCDSETRLEAIKIDYLRRDRTPLPFVKAWRKVDRCRMNSDKIIYDYKQGLISVRRLNRHIITTNCEGTLWWKQDSTVQRIDAHSAKYVNIRSSKRASVFEVPVLIDEAAFCIRYDFDDRLRQFLETSMLHQAAHVISSALSFPTMNLAELVVEYTGPWSIIITWYVLLNDGENAEVLQSPLYYYPQHYVIRPV